MNEQKSLIHHLVEAVERHRAERRTATPEQDVQSQQPGRLRRFLRWLTPNGGTLLLVAALVVTAQVWAKPLASPAGAPGPSANTVNYQGRLADSGGNPLDGTYGMIFSLWDTATGGNLVWGPEEHSAVPVSEGLFSVGLGSKTPIPTSTWNGDRYLEITVGGETLSPRELIRSVPVAGMALTVPDEAIGTAQIADGAVTDDKISPDIQLNGLIQSGGVNSGTSSGYPFREVQVSFAEPFQTVPSVVATSDDLAGIYQKTFVNVRLVTTDGFWIRWYKQDGSNFDAGDPSVDAYWIAVSQ